MSSSSRDYDDDARRGKKSRSGPISFPGSDPAPMSMSTRTSTGRGGSGETPPPSRLPPSPSVVASSSPPWTTPAEICLFLSTSKNRTYPYPGVDTANIVDDERPRLLRLRLLRIPPSELRSSYLAYSASSASSPLSWGADAGPGHDREQNTGKTPSGPFDIDPSQGGGARRRRPRCRRRPRFRYRPSRRRLRRWRRREGRSRYSSVVVGGRRSRRRSTPREMGRKRLDDY